jgi:hypothetical protein
MNDRGEFVVTWASEGQDGDGWGVYAQRFDAAGTRLGDEFRVNSTTDDDQTNPSVAMNDRGEFVVSWSSYGQDARNSWGVYAQRFDAAGDRLGGEFRVNSATDNDQRSSSVAMDDAGNFFITWSSRQQHQQGGSLYGRQYRSDGTPLGGEIQIETTSRGRVHSTVTMDNYGHAVVVWSGNSIGDESGVFMQRLNLTHTDLAEGISDHFEPDGHNHDHDHDAQEQQSGTRFAEAELDLVSDVASSVGGRGARGNHSGFAEHLGFHRNRVRRSFEGHRRSRGEAVRGPTRSRPVVAATDILGTAGV